MVMWTKVFTRCHPVVSEAHRVWELEAIRIPGAEACSTHAHRSGEKDDCATWSWGPGFILFLTALLGFHGISVQLTRPHLWYAQKSVSDSVEGFHFILSRINTTHWISISSKLCKIGIDCVETRNTSVYVSNPNMTWVMELHAFLVESSNNLVMVLNSLLLASQFNRWNALWDRYL